MIRSGTARRGLPFTGLIGAKDIRKIWKELPVSRRQAVIRRLFTVRVLPVGAGRPAGVGNTGGYFDVSKIDVLWSKPPARNRDLTVTK
jgi:hypothetical protein